MAGGLHEIGVRPGDRISLYSPNRWEWVVAYHAALRAGGVVNPINVMLTAEEVAFVLNDCGAAAIFTSGEKAEVIASMTRSLPPLRRVISFDPAGGGAGQHIRSPRVRGQRVPAARLSACSCSREPGGAS
jgi:long-chain acyl-CoA synthetase